MRYDDDDRDPPGPSTGTLLFFLGALVFLIIATRWDRCERAYAETSTSDPLALALMDIQPQLDEEEARAHVAMARAALEGTPFHVERVLAIAFVESSFDPRTVSRLECSDGECQRKLGVLLRWKPSIRGPYFCGVMQVMARHSRARCDELREDVPSNYVAGVGILHAWYNHPLCRKHRRGRMYCALLGYGGGKPLILRGEHRYPGKIERAMGRIKRRVEANTSS
jgi:hypothetical protein